VLGVASAELVCELSDPGAVSADLVGAKAANLARAVRAGFPTLDGLVLTTEAVSRGLDDPEVAAAADEIFERLGAGPGRPLVVRSSSTIEDAGASSMAGRFSSVLDVCGSDQYEEALRTVIGSADRVRDVEGRAHPLAVLVQCQAEACLGGVMFGIDPLSGERRHMVIDVVHGSPEALVSGRAIADHYVITRYGRPVRVDRTGSVPGLDGSLRRRLARMSRRAERAFGGPQDIEWLVDPTGRVVMLQTRPVTAVAATRHGRARTVLLGPGPVAETFPEALAPIEEDLWILPLREGLAGALRATGAVSERRLARSPVVTTVGGRVAVDLELIGAADGGRRRRRWYSPAAIGRRLGAAWRVGRLRAVLPELAPAVAVTVDRHLAGVGRLDTLTSSELGEVVRAARQELATVHLQEVLAGILLATLPSDVAAGPTAAGIALAALHRGRTEGLGDAALIAASPIVLVLAPPRLGGTTAVPVATGRPAAWSSVSGSGAADLGPREALRLRARWLQELLGRVAGELGARLVASGRLSGPDELGRLRVEELLQLASGGARPARLDIERPVPPGPVLPASFEWSGTARKMAPARGDRSTSNRGGGLGASGGRVIGTVVHDAAAIDDGAPVVLVTRHLEPALAGVLGRVAGLVSETGSPLSHLAILAREAGVPTVVAVPDAQARFPVGCAVELDGGTGEVWLSSPVEVVR
jgi:pyruvate,water dikinase